jgi:DNA-binding CsgD family transcriptional regulator
MNADDRGYRLPFPALQHYLGAASAPRKRDGNEHITERTWPCGCKARFRDSVHQTASWIPCAGHRGATRSGGPSQAPEHPAPALIKADNFLARRVAPQFCIVDGNLNVLYTTPDTDARALVEFARGHVAPGPVPAASATVRIDEASHVRIVPVSGTWTGAYALFVERAGDRGSLRVATGRYGLTAREVDVLGLIVMHRSNAQIAEELCIAESTVADHLRSLFRKMHCNRRTELFAALYRG